MLLAAVFCLSLSSLFYEILLTRFFSIAQWNHLSFMVISIALFGFAASGVFLNFLMNKKKGWLKLLTQKKWISRIIFLFSFTVAGSYIVVNATPIDYFRIPFDYMQVVFVVLSFLLLSLPFFFSGFISALAYSSYPEKAGIIYFISMAGSTLGAVCPVPGLPVLDIGGSILISSLFPLFVIILGLKKYILKIVWIVSITGLVVISFFIKDSPMIHVAPSPYKTLPQLLQLPQSRIEKTEHILQGKIDVVTCPSIRYVPGLSLKYRSRFPEQYAIIKDADMQVTFYSIDVNNPPDFPEYTLPYAGYLLCTQPGNILILQKGGGTALPLSLVSYPQNIILCEEHPVIAEYMRKAYNTHVLTILHKSHREYISTSLLSFDIIHIENWGSSIPGMASLSSEYLYTTEAMSGYIDMLTDRGILIIPRKLILPPSDSLRIFLSAFHALKKKGIKDPEKNIMLIKHWDIYTLLLSKQPFTGQRLTTIKEFCFGLGFDLLYYDGITEPEIERFVKSQEPFHFNEIQKLMTHTSDMEEYLSGYFLDISPQGDRRPFHNKYIKWGKLSEFYQSTGERFYTLLLSGEIIVWIVLAVALLVTLLILVLPVALIKKKNNKTSLIRIIYFLAIGAGFMFMEIAFIKEYTLLAEDPVVSFSFVLCIILIFSGIGGYLSSRLNTSRLNSIFIILLALAIILFLSIDSLVHLLLTLPPIPRFMLMGVIMIPLSLLMGIPFPSGIKGLLSSPAGRAYSWAANGCTSVLASIISVPIAMSFGIHVLFLFGGISYGVALVMFRISQNGIYK